MTDSDDEKGDCLIENGEIMTDDGKLQSVWIRVRGGIIEEIATAPLPSVTDEEVIDASGQIIRPGMVNAHAHSPLSATKGTTDRMDHPTFMWTNQKDTAGWSADEARAVTTLAAADMLRHGITAVVDHVPEQNAALETVSPIVEAWRQSGLRAAIALRIFDGRYDDIGDGGYAADQNPLKARPADDLLDLCQEAIKRWHRPDRGMQIFVGPSNSERCSDRLLADGHQLAADFETGFHAHLLETKVQRESCLATHGVTPVGRLKRLGALSARCSFAHCVWTDGADIELLAATKAVVAHNPHSNAKLGVGLMPLASMLSAGCAVALGTDGASTNDGLNLHEAMALSLLLQRCDGTLPRHRWPTADDALRMATSGGAAAMLLQDRIGVIAKGAFADLVFYDARSLDLYPPNDLTQQFVFAERGRSIRRVMVGGAMLFDDGRFPTLDIEGALDTAADLRRRKAEIA
jgi:cytosine/adenosine deaminase-related metal-dependent hydrolase